MISSRKSNDLPLQMKILNTVIPILMHFCSFIPNWGVASSKKPYIAGFTVANFSCYPIRRRVSKSCGLEYLITAHASTHWVHFVLFILYELPVSSQPGGVFSLSIWIYCLDEYQCGS